MKNIWTFLLKNKNKILSFKNTILSFIERKFKK